MTQSQIQAEVNYVNETNEPYVTGAVEFSWSAVGDNCAHFAHDVLAAGGIRTEIPRGDSRGRVIYNFVSLHWEIPTNDVLKDLEFANDLTQIRSAEEVFNDHDEREIFNRLGTLPRLGATIEEIPMHLRAIHCSNAFAECRPILRRIRGLRGRFHHPIVPQMTNSRQGEQGWTRTGAFSAEPAPPFRVLGRD